jgi:hypothetical protein
MKNTLVAGLGGFLVAAMVAAFAISPATATMLDGLTNDASSAVVQVAEGKKIKLYRRLISVEDGGKIVTFKGPNQELVKAKVSGSRTKIKFAKRKKGLKKAKMAKRGKLKAGLICTITYVAGGKNEPSKLDCHVR